MSSRSTAVSTRPRQKASTTVKTAPTDLRSLLGEPPLLDGEDVAKYEVLAREIDDAVQPNDAIEQIWARDLTDLTWEMLRLRRAREQLMRSSAHKGLGELLRPLVHVMDRSALCDEWAKREPEAIEEVDRVLAEAGIDQQATAAHTLRAELPTLEKIENLIARAEARRHAILREFDRRRDVIERRLRDIAEGVQDAEFKELPSRGSGP